MDCDSVDRFGITLERNQFFGLNQSCAHRRVKNFPKIAIGYCKMAFDCNPIRTHQFRYEVISMNRNTKYLIFSTRNSERFPPTDSYTWTQRANENFVIPWRNRGVGLGFRKVSIARQGFSVEEKGRMAARKEDPCLSRSPDVLSRIPPSPIHHQSPRPGAISPSPSLVSQWKEQQARQA